MIFNIAITIFFVFLNAFFVASEFALVKVRASQIEIRIRAGSKLAKLVKDLTEHIDSYLSACQLGITLASLGLGWIGESVVSQIIRHIILLLNVSLSNEIIHSISLPVAFITITIAHIVIGEMAPKSLAIQRSEAVSLTISVPLKLFYVIFKPIIWMLNEMANLLVRVIGIDPNSESHAVHSADELRYLLKESTESGAIDTTEHELIENVFEFKETPIKQVMVPRNRIVGVEISMLPEEIMEKFIVEGYSRMPIYKDSIDNIIGIIYAKDLINMMRNRNLIVLQDIIRLPYFVAEDQKINILLRQMQKQKIHIAIALDDFGGTSGVVTMEDIIEEIVGEIQDEYDEESPIIEKVSDTEFCINASAVINDINDYLPVPLPESEDYESIGGLITNHIGRIPEQDESIDIDNYNIKIVKASERSVELVRLTLLEKDNSDEVE